MTKRSRGTGTGKGHGGNTNLPQIRQVEKPPYYLMAQMQPGTKIYRMGKVTIFVSPAYQEADTGWHISISRPDRYPSWDEIAKARYELLPEEMMMVMLLPPPDEYINVHNHCFHLHELPPYMPYSPQE